MIVFYKRKVSIKERNFVFGKGNAKKNRGKLRRCGGGKIT